MLKNENTIMLNNFLKFCEKIFFNEIFCFLVIMSKKASGDQFSLSGGNSDSVGARKTVFCSGKDFFLGGSSYMIRANNSPLFQIWDKQGEILN